MHNNNDVSKEFSNNYPLTAWHIIRGTWFESDYGW